MTVVAITNIQKKVEIPFKRKIKISLPSLDMPPDTKMPEKNQAIPVYKMLKQKTTNSTLIIPQLFI